MSRTVTFMAAIVALVVSSQAAVGETRVGLMAPLTGPFALLGQQMEAGAEAAAKQTDVTLITADDRCEANGGASAARRLLDEGVTIVVGGLCSEAMEAALPVLTEAGVPMISAGVRADRFTDKRSKEGWLFWRVAPRDDAERTAVSQLLVPLWRNDLFAIVDDGTIYGREIAETFRLAAEVNGLKPVFVDTFRPQSENQVALVSRLVRSGAGKVFVGGDRDDIAIIARDAAAAGSELVIAGGELLRAASANQLQAGVLMVAVPEAPEIGEGYAVSAFAAVEIAAAASKHSSQRSGDLTETLENGTFETALGLVKFDDKGDLSINPYRLHRFDGEKFVLVEEDQ